MEAVTHLNGPQKELLESKENCSRMLSIFRENISLYFDQLVGGREREEQQMLYFELLALAQKRELEEMITLEGMVASARNLCSPNFIPFNARIGTLIPETQVDENNNPLDPNQITSAFEQSLQFLNFDALNRLSLFREFNENLLKQLDYILTELNELLKQKGVLPELQADYSALQPMTHQKKWDSFEDNPEDNPELFSIMQGLLHPDSTGKNTGNGNNSDALHAMIPTGSGIMQPVQFTLDKDPTKQKVEVLETQRLMDILDNIQKGGKQAPAKNGSELFDPYDINESLGNLLSKAQRENVILAVDRNSSDVINLVTMLYGAIWQDDSLPIPIKNLIGETQLTVTKLALTDTSFFNRENHPAREIINELANAGTGLLETEHLDQNPFFKKMRDLVTRVTTEYKGDNSLFDVSLSEFRRYVLKEENEKLKQLEDQILKADDRQDCLDDIHELVSKRVNERLLGRRVHNFFRESLENFLHKYLVLILLKDGPESKAWKQAINALDVLLWTLEFNKEDEDAKRVKTANSRILNGLRKAFKVSRLKEADIEVLVSSLMKAQKESLDTTLYDTPQQNILPAAEGGHNKARADSATRKAGSIGKAGKTGMTGKEGKEMNAYLKQVDAFNIGIWVEIAGLEQKPVRCKLAAKIKAIDKYIFVNSQGAKVLETNRAGLAKDLKNRKIKIVSDGLLFSRALESVIGNLQDSQDQQRPNPAFEADS